MRTFGVIALVLLAVFTVSLFTGHAFQFAPELIGSNRTDDLKAGHDKQQEMGTPETETADSLSDSGSASEETGYSEQPSQQPVEETASSAVKPLPIDFSPGMPPDPKGYVSDTEYIDPSIHVKLNKDKINGVDIWIADIEIADASQLRTAAADGFDSKMVMPGLRLAERMNAVLATEGDYFCYTGKGLIVRQGKKYLDRLKSRDVLVVDEDGDFYGFEDPPAGSIGDTINGKKIINAFFFGPLLVNNGEVRRGGYANGMAPSVRCQRMALAQTGHLKYRVIVCGPNKRGSIGMTIEEFRNFVASMPDVKVAYNMDGGDSTMIMFNGQKLNDPDNPDTREIADIVYFASAYTGES